MNKKEHTLALICLDILKLALYNLTKMPFLKKFHHNIVITSTTIKNVP